MKPTVYLANPLGFSELGIDGTNQIKNILSKWFNVMDPFEENSDFGRKIVSLENNEELSLREIRNNLKDLNKIIGSNNENMIKNADFVIAVLDGPDVDSGTAAEIGYAYGIGKKIFGYRGDFRYSCDNLGSRVNLQVEYFIESSGGKILRKLEDLETINKQQD